MTKKYLRTFLVLFTTLLVTTAWAARGFDAAYSRLGDSSARIDFNIDDFQIEEVIENGVDYSKIIFPGQVTTERKGFAKLPIISSTIQLSPFGDVVLKVVEEDYEDIKLDKPLLPSRGVIYRNQDPSKIAFRISKSSLTDSWYPSKLVRSSKPFIFRDVRGASVYVHPFRYNAAKNVLRVYKSVSVVLETSGKTSTNSLVRMNPILPTMDRIYRSMFINYNLRRDKRSLNVAEFGDILVIYTRRDKNAIQPYIQWKKEKGFKVFEKQVNTGTNVKDLIKSEYDKNPKLLYVQLVGDWDEIKSDLGPSNAPMDPMLGRVVGSDWFADIIIARFSGSSASDITTQVNKTIEYERNPDMGDGSWYRRAIGIGSNEGDGKGDDGEADWKHMDVIRDNKLLPTTYDLVHQDYAKNNINATTLGNHINDGVGLINYVGHGSRTSWVTSRFSNTDVGKLKNKKMMPFIVTVACVNGEFHKGESFAEAWLKKENGGAIGMWAATINQPWAPPMRGQDYFVDLLIGGYNYSQKPGSGTNISEQRTTYGSLTLNAAHLMYAENDGSSDLDTIKTWTVFGDGSLQVRTDRPKSIDVSSTNVLMGIPYTATIMAGGQPLSGAMVSLYQDGKSYVGITNEWGEVEIDHELEVARVKITVTGFNTNTFSQEVNVIPPDGPYVSLASFNISGDSQVDYGETVGFNARFKNLGTVKAQRVTARIESDSPYIASLIEDSVSLGDIRPGSTVTASKSFKVAFKESVPDQSVVSFMVYITDHTGDVYESKFSVIVNAPVLNYTFTVSGEGTVQPGDSRELIYEVKNTGHATAYNVVAKLELNNNIDADLGSDEVFVGKVMAGKSSIARFPVSFGDDIMSGAQAMFKLDLAADGGLNYSYDQALVIGMTESFEMGQWASFWTFGGNADWGVDTATVYDGVFSGKSGTIDHRQSTVAYLRVNYTNNGTISFFRKVSSEARYDKLKFYIDGELQDDWSGEIDWSEVSYDVRKGTHEFKWEYMKDSVVTKGQDCAWIDNVLVSGGVVR